LPVWWWLRRWWLWPADTWLIYWGSGADDDTFDVDVTTYSGGTVTLTKVPSVSDNMSSIVKGRWYVSAAASIEDHSDVEVPGSLAWVVAQIGSGNSGHIVIPPGNYVMADDFCLPAGIVLELASWALLDIDSGKTLTIPSPRSLLASSTQQIFDGDGLVTFTYPGTVYPDWWQENTTPGTTDMAPAINAAMVAGGAGATVQFNTATYLLSTISGSPTYLENYFVNLLDDRNVQGTGWGTILKIPDNLFDQSDDDTSNAHVFQGFDIENAVIRDMQIDMNGYNNLTPSGKTRTSMAVRLDDGGSNVLIENLYILNNPGHNNVVANNTSLASKATGLTVTNCVMYGGGTGVLGNTKNPDFSFLYS